MYIIVIGIGEVGKHLLSELDQDGHDVVAVDRDPAAVRYAEDHYDVMSLTGYGASEEILLAAGVRRADMVVAVSDNDEVNLIATLAAKQLGAKHVIARAFRATSGPALDRGHPLRPARRRRGDQPARAGRPGVRAHRPQPRRDPRGRPRASDRVELVQVQLGDSSAA